MENHVGAQFRKERPQVGQDGRDAGKPQAHPAISGDRTPFRLLEEGSQALFVGGQVRGKIRAGDEPEEIFLAGYLAGLPGQAIQAAQLAAQGGQAGLHPGHAVGVGAQAGHQGINFPGQLFPVTGIGELEVDDLDALGGQDFPQGLGIGAVPLAGGDDRLNLRVGHEGGVDPLDPGAEGAGEAGGFGLAHPGQGQRVGNEQVVQVHRGQVGGQHHLHRDRGGQAHRGARGERRGLAH